MSLIADPLAEPFSFYFGVQALFLADGIYRFLYVLQAAFVVVYHLQPYLQIRRFYVVFVLYVLAVH